MNNITYNRLIQVLKLIASPASIQISALPDFVVVADEIALMYEDVFIMIPQLKEERYIPENILDMLSNLEAQFEIMSRNKLLWSIDSLKESKSWENVRGLAHSILRELKEEYKQPNIDFITWIK